MVTVRNIQTCYIHVKKTDFCLIFFRKDFLTGEGLQSLIGSPCYIIVWCRTVCRHIIFLSYCLRSTVVGFKTLSPFINMYYSLMSYSLLQYSIYLTLYAVWLSYLLKSVSLSKSVLQSDVVHFATIYYFLSLILSVVGLSYVLKLCLRF